MKSPRGAGPKTWLAKYLEGASNCSIHYERVPDTFKNMEVLVMDERWEREDRGLKHGGWGETGL
jgi:hypothetical protein